ncbi:hypothetical protein SAMN05428975_4381 [Mucilaginibacter sp. OK268]|nr:hypothetical protein SAMN05428975_4381 [Mucilaginibacter sp. OK268]
MIKSMLCINRTFAIITTAFTVTIIMLNVPDACVQELKGLTIIQAYQLARESYPLIKQRDLITGTGCCRIGGQDIRSPFFDGGFAGQYHHLSDAGS